MHDGAHIPTPESTPVTRWSWAQLGAVVGVVSVLGAGCIGALAFAQDVGQERAALAARVAANAKALEACEDELEELAHVPSQIEAIDARTHEIASDVREIRALVIQIAQE
jgi:hypothetical protein